MIQKIPVGLRALITSAVCAAACETASPENDANAPADNCMDSRREIFMGKFLHAGSCWSVLPVAEGRLAHVAAAWQGPTTRRALSTGAPILAQLMRSSSCI